MRLISIAIVASLTTAAYGEYPFDLPYDIKNMTINGSFEVDHMPPTKSQGDLSLCHGMTATTLLENFRCKELNKDCSERKQLISVFDVASFDGVLADGINSKQLQEMGYPTKILMNIQKLSYRLASEECAGYSSLARKTEFLSEDVNVRKGWDYLVTTWNEFHIKGFSKIEKYAFYTAANIKKEIPKLKITSDQLADALRTSSTLERFLYRILVPTECMSMDNTQYIPAFVVKSYSDTINSSVSRETFKQLIETVILNNYPVQMNICALPLIKGQCPSGNIHAIVLAGVRNICYPNNNSCYTMVKVQNSLGDWLQSYNNNGWADLSSLIASSAGATDGAPYIAWVQKPDLNIQTKRLRR